MAKSILDIVIRTIKQGGADKETVKDLVNLKNSISQAAAVGASLAAAGYTIKQAFDATVGTMVAYAAQVRDVQRATQLSAEESSRLIQFTDDMGVSYDTLAKAIKSAADTTDFSIEGLARASDGYLNLTNANERAAYAQKLYGKAWVDMVAVLKKGGGAIRSAANEINGSLVLTQKAVDQARQYEVAVDNLGDSWQSLKVSMGTQALPVVNDMLLAMQKNIDAGITWRDAIAPIAMYDNIKALWEAHKELNPEVEASAERYTAMAEAAKANTESANELNASLTEQVANYSQIYSLTQSISTAEMEYSEAVAQVTADTSLSVEERKAKLDEIAAKNAETVAKIVADNLLAKLSIDGLTQAEFEKAIRFQESTGLITKTAADQAIAFDMITQAAADGKITVEQMQAAINKLQDKEVTLTINQVTNMIALEAAEAAGGFKSDGGGKKFAKPRAAGGPVSAGETYIVGENGPEIFVPRQGGQIIANGAAGGVQVNLSIASPVTIMDEEKTKTVLLPFIVDGIKQAQARGVLR